MQIKENRDRPNLHPRRFLSRTRLVMLLLLLVAIPVFMYLANKAVHENAEAIRQVFGR
jgi:hypothetical protein